MPLRPQPAYSLIFAFIIVTVMMLVAVTTIQNTNDKMAYYRDLEGGSKAYLAAQSAAEDGVLDMKDFNAGYEMVAGSIFAQDEDGDGTDETHGDYSIYGKAQNNDNDSDPGHWYLPMPGTGSAGPDGECSITATTDEEVDHPCNWNKLLYGQNATIPLYTDDGSGGLEFPYDTSIGFNGWSLKIRTPCVDPTDDPLTCTRYELDDGTSGPSYVYASDDSVVFWQISGSGTDSGGNTVPVSVIPDDAYRTGRSTTRDATENTEIYESLINTNSSPNDYVVMTIDDSTTASPDYSDLYNACMGDTDGDPATQELDLSSLTLQLDIVTPLKEVSTQADIPYLEWQLVLDSTLPLADNKSVIVGEGYHQGTEHIFYYPYVITRSTTGESLSPYTLSN